MLVGGDSTTTAHADPSRQRVGATAFGVAAFRAMESQSNDRPTGPLIHDAAAEAIFALVSGTAPLRCHVRHDWRTCGVQPRGGSSRRECGGRELHDRHSYEALRELRSNAIIH